MTRLSLIWALLTGCADTNAGDPMQRATGQAKKAAAKHLDVPADALTLDPIDDKSVPGVVVFRAVWSQGSRTAHVGGVVVGGEVELDGARAMGRVYQAWGYGPTRTRSAEEVARVAVNLVPSAEPSSVMASEAQLAPARRMGFAEAAAPADVSSGGGLGVKFWVQDGYNPVTEWDVSPGASPDAPAVFTQGRTHGGG